MASIVDGINLKRSQDRRVKLTETQRKEIYNKYNVIGGYSQRGLASEYGVSRRTITFIIDPKKLEENKKRLEERGGWKTYYNKDEHSKACKDLREYKRELIKNGEL